METSVSTLEFDQIIKQENIIPVFQPIFDITNGDLIGHEALTRGPEDSPFFYPSKLFTKAIQLGKLHELELICRQKSIQTFSELNLPGKLFLNVSASLLRSKEHQSGMTLSILKEKKMSQTDIVIELSEQHPYDNEGVTLESVEHYRKMGFQVAIDDLGVGYSGLKLWSDLQPEIVKIDQYFIRDIHNNKVKQEFVRSIVAIGNRLDCQIIAEGIETKKELNQLLKLGVTIGQGYLLGRPTKEPLVFFNNELKENFLKRREKLDHKETIQSLAHTVPFLEHDNLLLEASELFKKQPNLTAIPILKDKNPIGVIKRDQLHELFSTPYGRSLYENKHTTQLLNKDALIVESYIKLSNVSQQITAQDTNAMNNDIIVVENKEFIGMANVKDLLKQITELKIQNATYSNPLTFLPGNVLITQEITQRLNDRTDFHVAYFDLNDFKPFNDYFGYATGDEAIKMVGNLIKKHTRGRNDFIGHVGGDDFVVIFESPNYLTTCKTILKEFSRSVKTFYDQDSTDKGGIWSKNRQDEPTFYTFLSLSIGIINPREQHCDNHLEVAELAATAKKEAKKASNNALFLSMAKETITVS
ncbi:GGDEF domain-containing protein [Marinomonas algicola]|uniref:GGDEF domain-containing protein n=1 Tax=Marinomonas algicola TaxID=2773454 RepID=UPI00174D7C7C|nr:bifunctional diguanylate cyclase/phosphodiesterase [Marinomonas algicola]